MVGEEQVPCEHNDDHGVGDDGDDGKNGHNDTVERLYQVERTQPVGGIHYVAVGGGQAAVGLHAAHANGFLASRVHASANLLTLGLRTENCQAKEELHI